MDAVEDCICNKLPKPSLVTPHRIEKLAGIDHNIANACLASIAPHPGEASLYELCEETGQGRWLVKSASNPNEYWVDEKDDCVVRAIKTADGLTQLTPRDRENKAKVLVDACPRRPSSGAGWLEALVGVAALTALATSPIWIPRLINCLTPKPKEGRLATYVPVSRPQSLNPYHTLG